MFLGMSNTLRSLTASPISWALQEARRMARRHLERGGAARPLERADGHAEFLIPVGIDALEVAVAIERRLHRKWHPDARRVVEARRDGRAVVGGEWLRQLGNGDAERGKFVLDQIIADIRARRICDAARGRE